jgi:hypothetical protein
MSIASVHHLYLLLHPGGEVKDNRSHEWTLEPLSGHNYVLMTFEHYNEVFEILKKSFYALKPWL